MTYIHRDIENEISALSKQYPCLLIAGPKQVGKTRTSNALKDPERTYISLSESIVLRTAARTDPAEFLKRHKPPIIIDDIHYAPELFTYIQKFLKKQDKTVPGMFWLISSSLFAAQIKSQNITNASLAILHMTSFTQRELYGKPRDCNTNLPIPLPFLPASGTPATTTEMFNRIYRGFMPKLYRQNFKNPKVYYNNYIKAYIDQEIHEQYPRINEVKFFLFLAHISQQVGQVLNLKIIAEKLNISADTAKRWLTILRDSDIIFLLYPYSAPDLKRTLKRQKVYFYDTGLAAHLSEFIPENALSNNSFKYKHPLLENYAIAEYQKIHRNQRQECPIWYYKDKEKNSIDLVIEINPVNGDPYALYFVRIVNDTSKINMYTSYLDFAPFHSIPHTNKIVLCVCEEYNIDPESYFQGLPIWGI